MCGIAGVIDWSGVVEPALVRRMCESMEHRGPDQIGMHLEDGVGLGVQRLAIIDLAGGSQPVCNEAGDVVVIFNGEIYNHSGLRDSLIRRGHRFTSAVDTEVIAHLYEEVGTDLVHSLRGMFAFAIWDQRNRRLVCARDRVGKKPLFWTRQGSRFTFASELRALLEDETIDRQLDPVAIEAYLALQYVPHPLCAIRNVHKLPPACLLVLERAGTERIERYWHPRFVPKRVDSPREELEEELRALIDESIRLRLQSDVPMGALLSGGIDSSAVVATMAAQLSGPVKTFSVGFDEPRYDESMFARRVAERFATDHHELRLRADALEIMPKLARQYGEPFGDSSAVATFHLAELVSKQVKVVLTGDGGDELFGGYDRYVPSRWSARAERVPQWLGRLLAGSLRVLDRESDSSSSRTRLHRFVRRAAMDAGGIYASSVLVFDELARTSLLAPEFVHSDGWGSAEQVLATAWDSIEAEDAVDRMMGVDMATYLPGDLLVKMDIATMAHSVEARSPFLDQELIRFAASLPVDCKLKGSNGKAILRAALRGLLPDQTLDRPKMGFGVPLRNWLRGSVSTLAGDVLLDPAAHTRAYLRSQAVERLIADHQAGTTDQSMRIWVLMMLELWHREVLSSRRQPANA